MILAHDRVGSGPPVVCLHPIGLDRTTWDAVARHADGLTLLRVDLAGHGASPDRDPGMRVEDDADRVAATMAAAGLDRAVVAGVSFGGMVAQALALRHPGRVAALLAAACPPGIPEAGRAALAARGAAARAGGMAAVVEATMARWFSDGFRGTPDAVATRARLLSDDPANWAAAWGTIARFDLRDALHRIACPVLALAGGADAATPLDAMRALAEGVPDGRLAVVADAPHMLHLEAPGAVAAHLRTLALRPPLPPAP